MDSATTDPGFRTLVEYFAALEARDMDALLACFTDDVRYQHPPYGLAGHPGHEDDDPEAWNEARGKDALRGLFEFRGDHPGFTHHITTFARDRDVCMIQGYTATDGKPNEMTFMAAARVDETGLISEYQPYFWRDHRPIIGDQSPLH